MTTNPKKRWHPIHAYFDGVFNTASGMKIDLIAPSPEMITLTDIAGALSKICRFGGHVSHFYNVAQHSVLMAAIAPEGIKKEALFHDAAKAYIGDVIKPLKELLGEAYSNREAAFEGAIARKFGLNYTPDTEIVIKRLDRLLIEIEHSALQQGIITPLLDLLNDVNLLKMSGLVWTPPVAEEYFKAFYNLYFL